VLRDVVLLGDRAFGGENLRLYEISLTDFSAKVYVALGYPLVMLDPQRLARLDDDHLVSAQPDYFGVVDVSVPGAATVVTPPGPSGPSTEVYFLNVVGHRAMVADAHNLMEFDMTQPADPQVVRSNVFPDVPNGPGYRHFQVIGDRLWALRWNNAELVTDNVKARPEALRTFDLSVDPLEDCGWYEEPLRAGFLGLVATADDQALVLACGYTDAYECYPAGCEDLYWCYLRPVIRHQQQGR